MKKNHYRTLVGTALILNGTLAYSAPFSSFDPRSMAMGGAGVAVANAATAPYFNPSLLSVTRDEDDFAIELPIVGVRAYDPDDFEDSVDTFQNANYDTLLNNSINAVNTYVPPTIPTTGDLNALAQLYRDVAADTDSLNTGLATLDAKPIQAEVGAAVLVGIPSKKYGAAFSISATGAFAGVVNYKDASLLSVISSDVTAFAVYQECLATNYLDPTPCGTPPSLASIDPLSGDVVNPETGLTFDASTDIHSEVNVRGIVTQEVALSLSREFSLNGHSFAVGITPKAVKTKIYDYIANANTADSDDADAEDFAKEYSDFNIDVGVAKNYDNGWRTGFVIKNLISHEYETYRDLNNDGIKDPTGVKIKTSPQARLGISHTSDWHTVALDVDLTENQPVAFEDKSRYVALGAELNLADWAQFRAGYRVDMNNSERNIPSVGLGLSPWGVHLDLAAVSSSNEIGGSMQFGFRF